MREVTTITIDRNDKGDTLKVVQITDLTRARSRDNVVAQRVKTEVRVDTVYVEKLDSASVSTLSLGRLGTGLAQGGVFQDSGAGRASPFVSALKWICWILVAIGGLIIIIKVIR